MGLLDSLAGAALNQVLGSVGGNNALVKAALNMLTGGGATGAQAQGGGLTDLLQQLQNSGIADAVNSWISTGPNKPVSPQELQTALGEDTVAAVAKEAGVSTEQASSGLAALLPNIINHLTPDGSVPDNSLLTKGLGMLRDAVLKS